MYTSPLEERRKALEDAFFKKHDEELIQRLRESRAHEEALRELARTCGIHDEAVLEVLLGAGIEADTVAALALVPLVAVGWANGSLEPEERKALADAAHDVGIERGSPAHDLLSAWLAERPRRALLDAWIAYAKAVGATVDEEQRALIRTDFAARARRVAEAAGGFLGIHAISRLESETLDEVEKAFG